MKKKKILASRNTNELVNNIHQSKVEMQEKKNFNKTMKKKLREKERTFFVLERYAKNEREWQIYNKRLGIRRVNIKEGK